MQGLYLAADDGGFQRWPGGGSEVLAPDEVMSSPSLMSKVAEQVQPSSANGRRNSLINDIFTCHLCSYVGISRHEFDEHMTDQHYVYKCPKCNYSSRTQGRLRRHLKDVHTQQHQPDVTGIIAKDSRRPRRIRMIFCKYCKYSTGNQDVFWRHLEQHIPSEKQLRCSKCPFVTDLKHHYDYHIRRHSGVKPFRCHRCGYSCINKSMLRSHSKSHSNVYQFRCATCSFAAKYSHALKLHMLKYRHAAGPVLNEDGSLTLISNRNVESDGKISPVVVNCEWGLGDVPRIFQSSEKFSVHGRSRFYKQRKSLRGTDVDETNFLGGQLQMEVSATDSENDRGWDNEPSMDFLSKGLDYDFHLAQLETDLSTPHKTHRISYYHSTEQCLDWSSFKAIIPCKDSGTEYGESSELHSLRIGSNPSHEPASSVYQHKEIILKASSPPYTTSRDHRYHDREIGYEMPEIQDDRTFAEPLDLTKRKSNIAKQVKRKDNFQLNNSIRTALPSQSITELDLDRDFQLMPTLAEQTTCKRFEALDYLHSTVHEGNNLEPELPKSSDHYRTHSSTSFPLQGIPAAYHRSDSTGLRGQQSSEIRDLESKENLRKTEENLRIWVSDELRELELDGDHFECVHCRMIFRDPEIYWNHTSYHGDTDPFECRLCGEKCANRIEFSVHLLYAAHNVDINKLRFL